MKDGSNLGETILAYGSAFSAIVALIACIFGTISENIIGGLFLGFMVFVALSLVVIVISIVVGLIDALLTGY